VPTKGIKDATGVYRLKQDLGQQVGGCQLRFDRGTLLFEGEPLFPEAIRDFFHYDSRVDAYRAPAYYYSRIIGPLKTLLQRNQAPRYGRVELTADIPMDPFPHQQEALTQWQVARGRGIVVLPTGSGKTLVGLLALCWAKRDTLILVPTLDLMHQWYALLCITFPEQSIGLIGGGYHEVTALTVATYDSASRHIDRLGNRFGTLVFDEVHHLPSEFYRCIAEFSLAPYRLGLTATLERNDGKHLDLVELVGDTVYKKRPEDFAGSILAAFRIHPVYVELSQAEREAYQQAIATRNGFLQAKAIGLGSLTGWNRFVMLSARSPEGRRAMQAHREARRIAHATSAKIRMLSILLANHPSAKTLIFTEDNATAYEVSQRFLIPCMTHQTLIKERQSILEGFKSDVYTTIVTSNVLNEGVDIPDACVGIILSGSGSNREFVQRLGRILRRGKDKQAILYELVARETREEQVAQRRRSPVQSQSQPEHHTLPLFSATDATSKS
jgi:superfamily II DNA or RNA helicase